MYSESPSLGEPSADSVGNASVSDSVLGAMASQPVDDGDERRGDGSGTRLGEDDSAESVVSITDIFDRRTRELEDCEVKFTKVQQTKLLCLSNRCKLCRSSGFECCSYY